MADERFHPAAIPLSLADVAAAAGGRLAPGADPGRRFIGVAALEEAGPEQVGFLENRRLLPAFRASRAGACLVAANLADRAPAGMSAVVCDHPYRGYAQLAAVFHPEPRAVPGIHPRASVDPAATLGADIAVEAGAVIGARAEIGRGSVIGANTVIGPGVIIGEDSRIGALVSISHAVIGARVRIQPGARIGQDGFGFVLGAERHLKVPQLGRVVIGDDVEIGANTAIARGSIADTVIGSGTLIDNLVQIAHNVRTGRGCVIAGQAGISGSVRMGDLVVLGGQVGIADHVELGAGARVAAQSGVHRAVPPGETVGGYPAVPIREFRRIHGAMRRLARSTAGGDGDGADG